MTEDFRRTLSKDGINKSRETTWKHWQIIIPLEVQKII